MPQDMSTQPGRLGRYAWAVGGLAIVVIGAMDYYTGTELRVFPIYYAPIALLAWYYGRSGALIASALSAGMWVTSDLLAGLEFSSRGIWVGNTMMQTVSFVIVGLLIAQLRSTVLRERELSLTDPLTSLLNSRAFHKAATRVMEHCRRTRRPLTIAYVDLDNFKWINDRLGHEVGDVMLRAIAKRLLSSIRPDDVGARIGGDEFVVLYPETSPAEATLALERLRSSLASVLGSGPVSVTSSIGGVTFLTVPEKVEDLLREGDARMYEAKAAGRNRIQRSVVG